MEITLSAKKVMMEIMKDMTMDEVARMYLDAIKQKESKEDRRQKVVDDMKKFKPRS